MSDNKVSGIPGFSKKITLRVINPEFKIEDGELIYKAKEGDTLEKILDNAARFSSIRQLTRPGENTKRPVLSPEVLAAYNDLELKPQDKLETGQIIQIPLSEKQIEFETYMDSGDAAKVSRVVEATEEAKKILEEIRPKIEDIRKEIDYYERRKAADQLIEEINKLITDNVENWKKLDYAQLCEAQKPLGDKIRQLGELDVRISTGNYLESLLTDIMEGRIPAVINNSIIYNEMFMILGKIGSPHSVKVLIRLLNEVETKQRKPDTNFDGLGAEEIRFREKKYGEFLNDLKSDAVGIVATLGDFNDLTAVEFLGKVASGEILKDTDAEIQEWAISALARNFEKFKNPKALEKIYQAVETTRNLGAIIFGIGKLGEVGDKDSVPFIEKFRKKLPADASEALTVTIKDALENLKKRERAHKL